MKKKTGTHHNLHTNHTIQTSLSHAKPFQDTHILKPTVDQGVLAIHAQLVRTQFLQEALPEGHIGLHPIDVLDLGRVEPVQLDPRSGAQVEYNAVG